MLNVRARQRVPRKKQSSFIDSEELSTNHIRFIWYVNGGTVHLNAASYKSTSGSKYPFDSHVGVRYSHDQYISLH